MDVMDAIKITLREKDGLRRRREPLQLGVPFAQGALNPATAMRLTTDTDRASADLPFAQSELAYWPDGSVRWLKVNTRADLDPNQQLTLTLQNASAVDQRKPLPNEHQPSDTSAHQIQVANHLHCIEEKPFALITRNTRTGNEWRSDLVLQDADGQPLTAMVESVTRPEANAVYSQRRISGYFMRGEQRHVFSFQGIFWFYQADGLVSVELTLHNPRRARHPGGLWDLGDPGSLEFRHFGVTLNAADHRTHCLLRTEPGHPILNATENAPCQVYQDSSGGEYWNSQNHIDKDGKVTTCFKGYQTRLGDEPSTGLRAQPVLEVATDHGRASAAVNQFWQNFPNCLTATGNGLEIGLFPRESGQLYELQGGESKTHRLHLAFDSPLENLEWTQSPLIPVIPPVHYQAGQAFPWFKVEAADGPLERLIGQGVEGPDNFFAKRDMIDEYGWRHFGDIYADHENRPGSDEPLLVSHYNNQYDPLYGFARQFALTGDRRWFELMDDLARHIVDIDIYQTQDDKAVYNGGLFWHTDHYLDAATSTHRSFSNRHEAVYEDYLSGGGPGGEHCYTTGLMYHYLLTGRTASRQAVLTLTAWVGRFYEGTGSLTERLLSFLRLDLPHLKREPEGKQLAQFRYPLDRGVGNYITALMDSYLLTNDRGYVARAGQVVRGTVHPEEDIGKRRLDRVELAWFYSIFLQAVARYLQLKESIGELDEDFQYARAAFLHYTEWMLEHEYVYLTRPEKLEFPNHTWTAQELRKANLFYYAAYFSNTNKDAYLERAQRFYQGVYTTLEHEPERGQARILSILMQNQGHAALGDLGTAGMPVWEDRLAFEQPPVYSRPRILMEFGRDLAFRGLRLSPRRELSWLAQRSGAVAGLLTRLGFHFHRDPKC